MDIRFLVSEDRCDAIVDEVRRVCPSALINADFDDQSTYTLEVQDLSQRALEIVQRIGQKHGLDVV